MNEAKESLCENEYILKVFLYVLYVGTFAIMKWVVCLLFVFLLLVKSLHTNVYYLSIFDTKEFMCKVV